MTDDPRRWRASAKTLADLSPIRGEFEMKVTIAAPLGENCARLLGRICTADALAELLTADLERALRSIGIDMRFAVVDVRIPETKGCENAHSHRGC